MNNETLNTTINSIPKFIDCFKNKGVENLVLFLSIFSLFSIVIIIILIWVIKNNFKKQTQITQQQ